MMIKIVTVVLLLIISPFAMAESWACTNSSGEKAVFSNIKGGEKIAYVYVDLKIANFELKHVQFERVRSESTDFYHPPVENRDDEHNVNMRMSVDHKKLEIYKNGSLVGTLDSCKAVRPTSEKPRERKDAAL